MHECPHCTAPIGTLASSCWHCGEKLPVRADPPDGHDPEVKTSNTAALLLTDGTGGPMHPHLETAASIAPEHAAELPAIPVAVQPEIVAFSDPPLSEAGTTLGEPPAEVGTKPAPRPSPFRWSPVSIGIAGALVAMVGVVAFSKLPLQDDVAVQSHESTPTATAAAAAAQSSSLVQAAAAPAWEGRRQAGWARDGSKTISFELDSVDDIPVWMTRARPRLIVRCLSRRTEVFVSTGSAASIETQSGRHTIRLQLDDEPEMAQQWFDSVSSQELFSPDGVGLARRLAKAHHLRFGFTPFNAKPVTVDFIVEGFDKLAGLVANTCGWKIDERAAQSRPASIKQPRAAR